MKHLIHELSRRFRKVVVKPAVVKAVDNVIAPGTQYRLKRNDKDINPFEQSEVIVTVVETRTNQIGVTWVKYVMGSSFTIESTKSMKDFLAIYEPC